MNAESTIDWECWEVECPPADFVERVMEAARAESRTSRAVRRRGRSARWTGALAAAAVAAGSLTVLAMIERNARRNHEATTRGGQVPGAQAPSARSSGGTANGAIPSRVNQRAERAAEGTVIDRKVRDAVRAQLVPPLQAQGVERDPHTGLAIPAGASGPSHNLPKEYLDARIREDFYPLAMTCYESALAKLPGLRGQIVVDFMIVGDVKTGGIVDQVKINDRTDIADVELTRCIRESMLSMVFAPPENNGWVTVTYPFHFSPDDEDHEAPRER